MSFTFGYEDPVGMRTCPKCNLRNPSTALRCDCGFDFQSGESVFDRLRPVEVARQRNEARALIWSGSLCAAFAVGLFAAMYLNARKYGGAIIIWWGLALFGALRARRGYLRLRAIGDSRG